MTHSRAAARILCRGLDDWVQLVDVIHEVTSAGNALTPIELREEAMRVIAELLKEELIVIGDVTTQSGFVQWPQATTSLQLDKVRLRWDALGRPPILGDVCWLKLTDAGHHRANELFESI